VFGCQAVVWTPKEQRTSKAAPVGQRMIHIRRDERAKGYMFYNPKSRKTVISRDAQFLEDTPAYSEIASERHTSSGTTLPEASPPLPRCFTQEEADGVGLRHSAPGTEETQQERVSTEANPENREPGEADQGEDEGTPAPPAGEAPAHPAHPEEEDTHSEQQGSPRGAPLPSIRSRAMSGPTGAPDLVLGLPASGYQNQPAPQQPLQPQADPQRTQCTLAQSQGLEPDKSRLG